MHNVEHKVFFPLEPSKTSKNMSGSMFICLKWFSEECYDLVYVLDLDFMILPFVATGLTI